MLRLDENSWQLMDCNTSLWFICPPTLPLCVWYFILTFYIHEQWFYIYENHDWFCWHVSCYNSTFNDLLIIITFFSLLMSVPHHSFFSFFVFLKTLTTDVSEELWIGQLWSMLLCSEWPKFDSNNSSTNWIHQQFSSLPSVILVVSMALSTGLL